MNRHLPIVLAVLGFHALCLWALERASLPAAVDYPPAALVMAEWIGEAPATVTPPASAQAPRPAKPPAPQRMAEPAHPPASRPAPTQQAPAPLATDPAAPSASALATGVSDQPAGAVAGTASGSSTGTSASASPEPVRVDLPSSSARYLNNTPPPYPSLSKRLGEQGQVMVRVLIDTNGTATQAEIRSSSGFERLDQAALQTVLRWRYVPGKRNGMAEAMWFNVPIQFVLK
jgi:periplasmic protein TonB